MTDDEEIRRIASQRLEDKRVAEETSLERMATLRAEQAASEREQGIGRGRE